MNPWMVEVSPRGTVWYYRTATTGLENSTALDTTATQRTARTPESPGGQAGGGTNRVSTLLTLVRTEADLLQAT